MSIPIVSKKLKDKIINTAKSMEYNDMRFIYLLRNLGPQQFEKLIEYSGLSRSTVSKYLKIHERHGNIEKRLVDNKQKYCITGKGIERLQEKPNVNEIYYRNFDENISKLSEMLDFYKTIGVDEMIALQIVRLVSKIGKKFFQLEQNRDLYITIIYIYLNSVMTPLIKYEKSSFCKHYDIKKLRLDYQVDQIMSKNLGFFMFTRTYGEGEEEDIFFFHEEDMVGTNTLRLVKDKLTEIIIHLNTIFKDRFGKNITYERFIEIHSIDVKAKEIAEQLKQMKLIWDQDDKDISEKMKPYWETMGDEVSDDKKRVIGIIEPFEMLIEKILIKTALEMGFSNSLLLDLVVRSELLDNSIEGKKSLFNIIDGSERYEDLNLVSIEESIESSSDNILDTIKGFCPYCGKTIEKRDETSICPQCGEGFKRDSLLKHIDIASEKSKLYQYNQLLKEEEVECPNPKCERMVQLNWGECPYCHVKFKDIV